MADEIRSRFEAFKAFKKCRKCGEEFLRVAEGLCSKCGGWEARKGGSVRQAGPPAVSWQDPRKVDRRSMAADQGDETGEFED